MPHKNFSNLKSWKPGQSGNPAGRKPGSKNVSTIVRQLLEQDANAKLQETRIKIHSLQGAIKSIGRDVTERGLRIVSLSKNSPIYKTNEKYIEEQTLKMQELQGEASKLEATITDPTKTL